MRSEHKFPDCSERSRRKLVRSEHKVPGSGERNNWPRCTRECGVFMAQKVIVEAALELEDEKRRFSVDVAFKAQ